LEKETHSLEDAIEPRIVTEPPWQSYFLQSFTFRKTQNFAWAI